MRWGAAGATVVALAIAALGAPAAGAADARYEGSSADGSIVFFSTVDQLVPGDTDGRRDVFERSRDPAVGNEYVTRLVSVGPTGGNQAHDVQYAGASADGLRVFFSTKESLAPGDTDQASDVYMRDLAANATTLVSQGDPSCAASGCGDGAVDAGFVLGGIAAGGEKVFFATAEKLSEDDQDESPDIYMRHIDANATTLVSQGDPSCAASGCGNGPHVAVFKQASEDGNRAFFTSSEGLVEGDADGSPDIYVRDIEAGTTTLVSVAGECPAGLAPSQCNPTFGGASSDGSHAFFETSERLSGADSDESQDVYDWSGGVATLASTGPDGGNGDFNVTYAGNSADGSAVYFQTAEPLDSTADTDEAQDVYKRSGGATTLVSQGDASCAAEGCGNGDSPATLSWVSPDDSTGAALFSTGEPLTDEDTDAARDVYERAGGVTTLVSTGPAGSSANEDAFFAGAASDGSHVFFRTAEQQVTADEDESLDIYDRSGGATTLVSTGPIGGNGPFPARLHGVSEDGSRIFFVTDERLTVDDDFAAEDDVYLRSAAGTLLMSVGNDPGLEIGPPAPSLEGTDPPSPGESTEPAIVGQAAAGTEIKLYETPDCSGEQARGPGGEPAGGTSAELTSPGIAVAVAAGSTTTFYATAEAEGIVSPCSNGVDYIQEAAPPPPPPPEGESGGEEGGGDSTGGGSGDTGSGGSNQPAGGGKPQFHSGGIAYVTPESRITFGPSFKTRKRRAVFRFTDATGQPGTRFICKLDRRRWHRCGSPKRLKGLGRGKHVFKVKAVNAAGAWEARPVKRRFKVVRR